MNWQEPPDDGGRGGDNKYDIYIRYIGNKGETYTEQEFFPNNEYSSSFYIVNKNLQVGDELKATVAHEFSHACQFAYTYKDGVDSPWFYESSATWMQTLVFPDVHEELRFYHDSNFNQANPLKNTEFPVNYYNAKQDPPYFDYYHYANFILLKFYAEWIGNSVVVRKFWERLGNVPGSSDPLDEIDWVLSTYYNTNGVEGLRNYGVWRYFTGDRDDNLHYSNAYMFPMSTEQETSGGGNTDPIQGPGGTLFIPYISNHDLIYSFDGGPASNYWEVSVIEYGSPDSSNVQIILLDSENIGQSKARAIENDWFVLVPVKTNVPEASCFFSTAQLQSRSVKFENSVHFSEENLGGEILVNSQTVLSGARVSLNFGSNNAKTLEERFLTTPIKKHNNWNYENNAYFLNSNFDVDQYRTRQTARFKELKNAQLRVKLDDIYVEGSGKIWFNDPWYLKSNGTQCGMNDPLYIESGYVPTGGDNVIGNGIFEDQLIEEGLPYYWVKSDAVQNVSLNGQISKYYFQNWSGTNVLFEDADELESGVVFTNDDAVVNANLKGNLISNQTDALTGSSQRKIIRDGNGIYHAVYTSMDKLWYTKSLTTNFNGSWSQEQKISIYYAQDALYTNPSIDIYGNILAIVFEAYYPSEDGMVFLLEMNLTNGSIYTVDSAPIDATNIGNANPVVSYDQYHRIYIYDKSLTDGLSYKRNYFLSGSSWSGWLDEELIPNTTSLSKNPSIAGCKPTGKDFHLVWQEGSAQIRYYYIYEKTDYQLWFTSYSIISSGNGYTSNEFPSISLMESYYDPIVSWTAKRKEQQVEKITGENAWVWVNRMVTLPGTYNQPNSVTWGNFYITGSNVGFTNNNSTSSTTAETVVAWSQNNGAVSKWLRRTGTTYSAVEDLSHNGTQVQISNSSTLSNMKGLVLSNGDLPYILQRTTTDFQPMYKISGTNGPTYSRTGVVYKNSLEFVFNIGDILLNGENVLFVERADTLPIASITELNEALNTNTFSLNSNSELLFSNYYFVVNPELADSLLTEDNEVTFMVQLVNADNNQVVGTFDQVTYDRTNVGDYDNIDYTVDCSGIEDGNYYFRLVTSVEGNSLFFLSNVQNDAENLGKKNYTNIYYDGTVLPKTYELSQNYPNPFNPSTTIKYQIPASENVTLKIYDILGREVTTLVDEFKTEGRYEVTFNASRLASGVYIYRIQTGEYTASRKLILLK